MSVVVERGSARCPRCVAAADYTFVETGPESVRYEVRCKKCGETYCEVSAPYAPGPSAVVAPFTDPSRHDAADAGRPLRRALNAAAPALARGRAVVAGLGSRVKR